MTITSGTERSTQPCQLPRLTGLDVAARYHEPRIGGDFFDVAFTEGYIFLVMTDIAGERNTTQRIAAAVQEVFHQQAAQATGNRAINETEAAVEMLRSINGAIMAASEGVRCSPTFIAIYNRTLHLLTYISAGAPAALMLSNGEVRVLESNGIPLGLFTHLTHDPLPVAVEEGARLVLVSKGVIEHGTRGHEFGMKSVCELLMRHQSESADAVCAAVLDGAEKFTGTPTFAGKFSEARQGLARMGHHGVSLRDEDQDMTVLTLARS